jgi:hypothetical protein
MNRGNVGSAPFIAGTALAIQAGDGWAQWIMRAELPQRVARATMAT